MDVFKDMASFFLKVTALLMYWLQNMKGHRCNKKLGKILQNGMDAIKDMPS